MSVLSELEHLDTLCNGNSTSASDNQGSKSANGPFSVPDSTTNDAGQKPPENDQPATAAAENQTNSAPFSCVDETEAMDQDPDDTDGNLSQPENRDDMEDTVRELVRHLLHTVEMNENVHQSPFMVDFTVDDDNLSETKKDTLENQENDQDESDENVVTNLVENMVRFLCGEPPLPVGKGATSDRKKEEEALRQQFGRPAIANFNSNDSGSEKIVFYRSKATGDDRVLRFRFLKKRGKNKEESMWICIDCSKLGDRVTIRTGRKDRFYLVDPDQPVKAHSCFNHPPPPDAAGDVPTAEFARNAVVQRANVDGAAVKREPAGAAHATGVTSTPSANAASTVLQVQQPVVTGRRSCATCAVMSGPAFRHMYATPGERTTHVLQHCAMFRMQCASLPGDATMAALSRTADTALMAGLYHVCFPGCFQPDLQLHTNPQQIQQMQMQTPSTGQSTQPPAPQMSPSYTINAVVNDVIQTAQQQSMRSVQNANARAQAAPQATWVGGSANVYSGAPINPAVFGGQPPVASAPHQRPSMPFSVPTVVSRQSVAANRRSPMQQQPPPTAAIPAQQQTATAARQRGRQGPPNVQAPVYSMPVQNNAVVNQNLLQQATSYLRTGKPYNGPVQHWLRMYTKGKLQSHWVPIIDGVQCPHTQCNTLVRFPMNLASHYEMTHADTGAVHLCTACQTVWVPEAQANADTLRRHAQRQHPGMQIQVYTVAFRQYARWRATGGGDLSQLASAAAISTWPVGHGAQSIPAGTGGSAGGASAPRTTPANRPVRAAALRATRNFSAAGAPADGQPSPGPGALAAPQFQAQLDNMASAYAARRQPPSRQLPPQQQQPQRVAVGARQGPLRNGRVPSHSPSPAPSRTSVHSASARGAHPAAQGRAAAQMGSRGVTPTANGAPVVPGRMARRGGKRHLPGQRPGAPVGAGQSPAKRVRRPSTPDSTEDSEDCVVLDDSDGENGKSAPAGGDRPRPTAPTSRQLRQRRGPRPVDDTLNAADDYDD